MPTYMNNQTGNDARNCNVSAMTKEILGAFGEGPVIMLAVIGKEGKTA